MKDNADKYFQELDLNIKLQKLKFLRYFIIRISPKHFIGRGFIKIPNHLLKKLGVKI